MGERKYKVVDGYRVYQIPLFGTTGTMAIKRILENPRGRLFYQHGDDAYGWVLGEGVPEAVPKEGYTTRSGHTILPTKKPIIVPDTYVVYLRPSKDNRSLLVYVREKGMVEKLPPSENFIKTLLGDIETVAVSPQKKMKSTKPKLKR